MAEAQNTYFSELEHNIGFHQSFSYWLKNFEVSEVGCKVGYIATCFLTEHIPLSLISFNVTLLACTI